MVEVIRTEEHAYVFSGRTLKRDRHVPMHPLPSADTGHLGSFGGVGRKWEKEGGKRENVTFYL